VKLRIAILSVALLFAQQAPRSLADVVSDLDKLMAELKALAAPSTGQRILVAPGESLQAALDRATGGDTVVLQPGARYVGALTLGAKTGGVVTVQSSATLPNRRITPGDSALLPIIASGNLGPAVTGTGAANWKLDGLAFESTSSGAGEILAFEGAENVTLDRLLIVAGPNGQKRAIRGNGRRVALVRSWVANIIRAGQDSQAFAAWEGAGPYLLDDNYLEASGENVLFGGSDNYLGGAASNPADITITRNYFFKPLAWKAIGGTVKNLFELKNATRVVIRDNVFENNWTDAQAGWSIVLTPKNQDGRAPWTVVKDVLFERNVVKGVERGVNLTGRDYAHVTQQASGIVIRKNVIETSGQCLQVGGELADLTVEDNVCDNGYNIATLYVGGILLVEGAGTVDAKFAIGTFAFNRNVARHNDYGIIGGGIGTPALTANVTTWTFLDNRFVGLKRTYPATTVNIDEPALAAAKAALLKEIGR
jgi:hypothetical protein